MYYIPTLLLGSLLYMSFLLWKDLAENTVYIYIYNNEAVLGSSTFYQFKMVFGSLFQGVFNMIFMKNVQILSKVPHYADYEPISLCSYSLNCMLGGKAANKQLWKPVYMCLYYIYIFVVSCGFSLM